MGDDDGVKDDEVKDDGKERKKMWKEEGRETSFDRKQGRQEQTNKRERTTYSSPSSSYNPMSSTASLQVLQHY
jgi:hypothetical protein